MSLKTGNNMNWNLVSKPTAAIQEYHLSDDNGRKLVLKYNPRHHSARISSENHMRLFYIESAGQLAAKTFFKDQYGMKTGQLELDKWSDKIGTITIDNKRYNCQLVSGDSPCLIIYESNPGSPLISCPVQTSTGILNNSCLLLGLCMYLFYPVAKQGLSAFA